MSLRLAEMIRLGAKEHPQANCQLLTISDRSPVTQELVGQTLVTGQRMERQDVVATCALGAAWFTMGQPIPLRRMRTLLLTSQTLDNHQIIGQLQKAVPEIMQDSPGACPAGCGGNRHGLTIGRTITHLNDCHRWTREAIADWVASL